MYRVTKIGGIFFIITHGEPEIRLNLFNESLQDEFYDISYEKVPLSLISDILNSINSIEVNDRNFYDQEYFTNILIDGIIYVNKP
jgi:hypothetical protein